MTVARGDRSPSIFNVPNSLSLGRLLLAAVALLFIDLDRYSAALAVFVVAAVSDGLDGYLARRLNQVTAFGRQLDPLVDKLMITGLFIYLLPIPNSGLAPWMVVVIVARELIIQWLRSLMEGSGVAFGADLAGKAKTMLQCLSICAILIGLAYPQTLKGSFIHVRDVLIWSAVLLTLYSGLQYLLRAIPRLRNTLLSN
jgi:CDP-diacylglycerol---glycerol-3-phosphate 3-phosphatidyltransferase